MSVEFSNAYQDILFDNLISIIKQNFVFQTQLKIAEDTGKAKAEIQAKYDELFKTYESIKGEVGKIESYKVQATQNNSAHEEKQRIQTALNDVMKKKAGLEKTLEERDAEITRLKEYISKLETIAPVSKLKKISPDKKIEEVKTPVEPASDLFSIKANDGSSF